MALKDYRIYKRELMQNWLSETGSEQTLLFTARIATDQWTFSPELREFLSQHSSSECIYVMTVNMEAKHFIPVYIGKSTHVLKRWESHLQGFFQRRKTYLRWWDLLVAENRFCFDTCIFVIPQEKIVSSPLPDFPLSVGSVEYQLISLASDAYPEYLLNREGNRR